MHRNYLEALKDVRGELESVLQPIREKFQTLLDNLAGTSFDTLEANQRLATLIQETANRLGMALECPRPNCGKASKIRCYQAAGAEGGVFQFNHALGSKRTNHGSYEKLPHLRLVAPPPDRRKRGTKPAARPQ